ncbi:hypothetical protein NKG05_26335 [Oerskovia sp. M15]
MDPAAPAPGIGTIANIAVIGATLDPFLVLLQRIDPDPTTVGGWRSRSGHSPQRRRDRCLPRRPPGPRAARRPHDGSGRPHGLARAARQDRDRGPGRRARLRARRDPRLGDRALRAGCRPGRSGRGEVSPRTCARPSSRRSFPARRRHASPGRPHPGCGVRCGGRGGHEASAA